MSDHDTNHEDPLSSTPATANKLEKLAERAAGAVLDLHLTAIAARDPITILTVQRELAWIAETATAAGAHVSQHFSSMERRTTPIAAQ